ncbi:uncharacterized protein LOC133785485 [Humulus lupulus]|uniref:uncharacterized protein LOC133785485 n=1 Tax=Humulus lupulus TaxID=3486 RepID=UPI002B417F73|nr:uncharacterized protein LOC133785485 [Humulus lupulus]
MPMKQLEAQPDLLNQFMTETRAFIRILETQIDQLDTLMKNRAQGNFPSTTEVNAKEQCNAISLRSGTQYDEPRKNESEEVNQEQKIKGTRLQKNKLGKQFSKFFDVFQKLLIGISFVEALEQTPSYVKFVKEIMSKKRKLGDHEIVALTEECSAILQKKLPSKLKDPSSFNILCFIGGSVLTNALFDLGSSVNLMPL